MATGGRVRCTWFEKGRRCELPPTQPHNRQDGELWAFLCMAHEHELQKVIKKGTIHEIRGAFVKAAGRKK
jgi:hypothetical protein